MGKRHNQKCGVSVKTHDRTRRANEELKEAREGNHTRNKRGHWTLGAWKLGASAKYWKTGDVTFCVRRAIEPEDLGTCLEPGQDRNSVVSGIQGKTCSLGRTRPVQCYESVQTSAAPHFMLSVDGPYFQTFWPWSDGRPLPLLDCAGVFLGIPVCLCPFLWVGCQVLGRR